MQVERGKNHGVNFDDISSSSSEEDGDTTQSNEDELSRPSDSEDGYSVEERLTRAESSKYSGNTFFKDNENKEALKFYNQGLRVLEKVDDEDST